MVHAEILTMSTKVDIDDSCRYDKILFVIETLFPFFANGIGPWQQHHESNRGRCILK